MFNERKNCPICESKDFYSYFTCKYTQDPVFSFILKYYQLTEASAVKEIKNLLSDYLYDLNKCNNCNATFQKFVPGDVILSKLYGEWISSNNESNHPFSKYNHYDAQHYIAEAMKLTELALKEGAKNNLYELNCLDFGLGKGGFALALKACFVNVDGYEYDKGRSEKAASAGINMVDIEQLINSGKYNLINTEQVFEHLGSPLETIQLLKSSLAPGGLLKISVPYGKSIEKGDYKINWQSKKYGLNDVMPNHPLEHLQYYARPSLEKFGRDQGLEIVKISSLDHIKFGSIQSPRAILSHLSRSVIPKFNRNYIIFKKPT